MALAPTIPGMLRRLTLPRMLLLGATILGLLTSAQHFAVMQLNEVEPSWKTLSHALRSQMPFWYLWVGLAPVAVVALRRVPLTQGRLAGGIAFHVGLALACVAVHSALLLASHRLLGFPTPDGPFWTVYRTGVPYRVTQGLLGYLVLFGAVLAADYHDRFRERERAAAALTAQLAESRLQALRMQLNPHFLFNTLNTIAMLVRGRDHGQAVRVLASLSDILRYVLEDSPPQEVTLREELAFIDRYLAIERCRFPDRLQVSVAVSPDVFDAQVPNLLLQPLVENAIRHGIVRRAGSGRLEITGGRSGDRLVLEVRDDGAGLRDALDPVTPATGIPVSAAGIGLKNTAARLAQLYGAAAGLELVSRAGGGVIARVVLPFRVAPAESLAGEVAGVG